MILTTTENIPGKEIIEVLGIVKGVTVRAKHVGRDVMASLKQVIGGEIRGYTEMLNDCIKQAEIRMQEEALKIAADAIVGVKYNVNISIMNKAEIVVYGTAVKIVK